MTGAAPVSIQIIQRTITNFETNIIIIIEIDFIFIEYFFKINYSISLLDSYNVFLVFSIKILVFLKYISEISKILTERFTVIEPNKIRS